MVDFLPVCLICAKNTQMRIKRAFDGHSGDLGLGELGEVIIEDGRGVEAIAVAFGCATSTTRPLETTSKRRNKRAKEKRQRTKGQGKDWVVPGWQRPGRSTRLRTYRFPCAIGWSIQ